VLRWEKSGNDLIVFVPELTDGNNTVFAVVYKGGKKTDYLSQARIVSSQYPDNTLDAVYAKLSGKATAEAITYSYYFGDWKHVTCITGLQTADDAAEYKLRFTEPGDYKLLLEYSCPDSASGREGVIEINNQQVLFRTLATADYSESK